MVCRVFFVVWWFSCLVLAAASDQRSSGLVVWWFSCLVSSRADARDTGAALLIRGGGALGVETPAHEGRKCYSNAKVIKKRDK